MRILLQLYLKPFRGLSREVWLLSLVMLINRSGTMVIPFLSLYLTHELGFTLAEAGLVLSCFGGGSLLGSWLGGRLTDRFGYYEVQFWSLLVGGLLFLTLKELQSLPAWCALVFLTSTVSDAFRPANMAAVGVYARPENVTRSITLNRLAVNLGWAAGPGLAGWLAHTVGYEVLFWVNCFAGVTAALVYRATLKPKPEPEAAPPSAAPGLSSSSEVWHNRPFLLFVLLQLLVIVGFMQIFSTLPIYLEKNVGMSEGAIGLLISANGLLIALTEMPLVAWLENRYRPMRLIRLGMIFIGASMFLLLLGEDWRGFIWLYLIGITVGEMINFPFGQTYALSLTQPHNRGRYMGLYGLSFSGAFILAPWLGAQLVDRLGWSALWIILGSLTLLAAVGVGLLPEGRRRPKVTPTPAPPPGE